MGYRGNCSLCGTALTIGAAEWHRELGSCPSCGLNARLRGIVLALGQLIYGDADAPLIAREARKDVRILGITDNEAYAAPLAERFDYINTFLHQPPRLDICDPAACRQYGGQDIVICSDVIEHTLAGPSRVVANLLTTLRPGGALILTAPTFAMDDSVEWYGGLADYHVEQEADRYVLRWRNLRGQEYTDPAPIFHGGPGATAELRVLSHPHLLTIAAQHGAAAHTVEFQPEWGYSWPLVPQFDHLAAPADGRVIVVQAPIDTASPDMR